jgi:hypothetical protein
LRISFSGNLPCTLDCVPVALADFLGRIRHGPVQPLRGSTPNSGHSEAALACLLWGHKQTFSALFDYLVGAREQGRRQLEVKHLCGGQVDGQLKMDASFTEFAARMVPTLFRDLPTKAHKRLADGVYGRKLHPYMLQSGTEAANWIRQQGSQTWPRARDTINLSQFARKIFSAPSSSRGT